MGNEWSWTVLRAGSFRLDGGGMFGVVPKTLWSELSPPDSMNRIGMQCNCLLLENDGQRVLIETGFGDKWSDKERGFYDLERRTVVDALAEIKVEPQQIDLVIVTHLHFDHAAALTHLDDRGNLVPTFSNADVVVQRQEWEDARANRSTMSRTYLESTVKPIVDRMRLVALDQEVLAGISVMPVPGHTWGQQAVLFDDGHGIVCFPGDVIPTVHHVAPAFNMGYDVMPYENMKTKMTLLARAVEEGWRLILDHEPGEPVVVVMPDAQRPGRYRLNPIVRTTS